MKRTPLRWQMNDTRQLQAGMRWVEETVERALDYQCVKMPHRVLEGIWLGSSPQRRTHVDRAWQSGGLR